MVLVRTWVGKRSLVYCYFYSICVGGSIGGLFGHYIMNVRFRHSNQPTITLYETYTLMYNTLKYQFLRMLCGRANTMHWD